MATRRGRPRLQTESERKRRKTQRDFDVTQSRITIGECIQEWKLIKVETGMKRDSDVARMLIDRLAYFFIFCYDLVVKYVVGHTLCGFIFLS